MKTFVFFVLALIAYAYGDCYMQNPRGSNDRLFEGNTNRDNANRLFDSQNNAKGGYCVGPPLNFYEGSQLTIEWTSQHGCGNANLHCNVVLQYMCSRTVGSDGSPLPGEMVIRDGSTTNTITFNGNTLAERIANAHIAQQTQITGDPNDLNDSRGPNSFVTGGFEFGMHENVAYYDGCATRERNQGLFVAERVTNGDLQQNGPATRTRQNNNGNRNGLECPEERDYYPYWHPTPWKDIGVVTDQTENCGIYQSESQNVKSKNVCTRADNGEASQYNNQAECISNGDLWQSVPSFGLAAPACVAAPFNRDNHLGNGITGFANTFNWTLPLAADESCIGHDDCNCVLRIRYNISTGEFVGYGKNAADIKSSGLVSPVVEDPYIQLNNGAYVRLAVDTTQFGRTFQDRSHVFHIRPRSNAASTRMFNLNVRGKRGNIVQTYPATEYDFVPQNLRVRENDVIHFQWTGCDNNPAGNAGEGTNRQDRTNIVQTHENDLSQNHPMGPGQEENGLLKFNGKGDKLFSNSAAFRMASIGQDINNPAVCINNEAALKTAAAANPSGTSTDERQDRRNCGLLNGAPTPYFDGGRHTMTNTGTFNYMGTRNNNFSNRSQKAQITVDPLFPVWSVALMVIAGVACLGSLGAGVAIVVLKASGAYGGSVFATVNSFA